MALTDRAITNSSVFFHKATKTYKLVVTTNCAKRSAVRRWLFAVVLRCGGPMESDPNKWTERLKRVLQDELPGRECSDLRGLRTAAGIRLRHHDSDLFQK